MNEIVKSVSIEGLCRRRDRLLEGAQQLFDQIDALDELGSTAGGGLGRFQDWFLDDGAGHDCALRADDPLEFVRKRIDRSAWLYLMNESGLTTYMDTKAREEWRESLRKDVPALTIDNITATFGQLYEKRIELRDRGVINVFRQLSWHYKTNLPQMLGAKIILEYTVTWSQHGFSMGYANRSDVLNDLDRVFRLIDGKPELEYRDSVASQMREEVNRSWRGENTSQTLHTPYMDLKWFKKGTCHVSFNKPELVEALNDIIAKHYPDAIPVLRAA